MNHFQLIFFTEYHNKSNNKIKTKVICYKLYCFTVTSILLQR